jgi:hypothetical protein
MSPCCGTGCQHDLASVFDDIIVTKLSAYHHDGDHDSVHTPYCHSIVLVRNQHKGDPFSGKHYEWSKHESIAVKSIG